MNVAYFKVSGHLYVNYHRYTEDLTEAQLIEKLAKHYGCGADDIKILEIDKK